MYTLAHGHVKAGGGHWESLMTVCFLLLTEGVLLVQELGIPANPAASKLLSASRALHWSSCLYSRCSFPELCMSPGLQDTLDQASQCLW